MTGPSSRHLVDPELLPLLDAFPTLRIDAGLLPELRRMEAQNIPPVEPDNVRVSTCEVPGPTGAPPITLRIYRPETVAGAPIGCIYHIHGGGYVGGSAAQVEFYIRPFARELGCAIVSVDYRLAPENPHPAPIEDCYAGLAWLFGHADELGIDPARIGVMGESAGGGLAAALALLARDRGEYRLSFQSLTYPMIDDRTCVRETSPWVGEFIWTRHNNRFGWSSLLGREPGGEGVEPYAAAARASELSGLPPTYLDTGSLDLFLDENLDYARRLAGAGGAVELHVWPGAFHGFELGGETRLAARARGSKLEALRRFLTL